MPRERTPANLNRRFSTTIQRKYLDMKIEDAKRDGFFYEYKAYSEFWWKRIFYLTAQSTAKFMSGNVMLSADILEIQTIYVTDLPERYRDREMLELFDMRPYSPAGLEPTEHEPKVWRLKCLPVYWYERQSGGAFDDGRPWKEVHGV